MKGTSTSVFVVGILCFFTNVNTSRYYDNRFDPFAPTYPKRLPPYGPPAAATASGCTAPALEHGRVRSRLRARLVRFQCLVGYEMVGNKYATCSNGEWDVPAPVCVRPGCPPLRDIENGIRLQSHRGAYAIFFCGPGHQLTGSSVLYCNGSTWNSTRPVCVDTTVPPSLSCEFERVDLCGWKNDEFHDFDWRRFSKKTPSAFMNTGPSHDHTFGALGTGHYLYVESTGKQENEQARLLSPIFDSELGRGGCFSFYYHMFGKTTGTLRVYEKPVSLDLALMLSAPVSQYKKFEMAGNHGDHWYRAVFDLEDFGENFQIVIEGVRGSGFTSDIAIDDVEIFPNRQQCQSAKDTIKPFVLQSGMALDSCANRCNSDRFFTDQGEMFECSCWESCLNDSSCCADYRDICDFGDREATSVSIDSYDTSTVRQEPAPQTMKLVALSSIPTTAITSSTSAETSTTTETTTSSTTTSTARPSTILRTTARSTTFRTTKMRTTVKPTTVSRVTFPPQTTKSRTSIIPRLIFKTSTPEPFNATGLLGKTNVTRTPHNVTQPKNTLRNRTTNWKRTSPAKTTLEIKITEKTTRVPTNPTKATTLDNNVLPISRTFENHNTYHELVKAHKAKQEELSKKGTENGRNLATPIVGTLCALLLLATLLLLIVRGRQLRGGVERAWLRARGGNTGGPDEVRYLTRDDHLDFD